jgi:hypothetical protein
MSAVRRSEPAPGSGNDSTFAVHAVSELRRDPQYARVSDRDDYRHPTIVSHAAMPALRRIIRNRVRGRVPGARAQGGEPGRTSPTPAAVS